MADRGRRRLLGARRSPTTCPASFERRDWIEEQTRGAIANLAKILEAVDSDIGRVVWIQVGLADPRDYAPMNAEYIRHFPDDRLPARATVRLGFESPGTRVVMACTALAGRG